MAGQIVIATSREKGQKPIEFPTKTQQAKNLAKAIAQHAKAGWKKASKEESSRRWAICQQCEYLFDGKHCSLCGCGMEFKSTWQEQHCEDNRW